MTRKEELFAYALNNYGVEPDYPFSIAPTYAVLRHQSNRKWFALAMRLPYRTLGMNREGAVDILNIKCDPFLIGSLRGKPGFLPAYHMNKDKWLTVLLDGSAGREEITGLLALSYELTAVKAPKKRKAGSSRPEA